MSLHCPNCSAGMAESSARCDRCGYRAELAGEYLWIYAGGCAVILLGFLVGALGIATERTGPDHWSRMFEGWCPFAPWPRGSTWIGFLALGIALTGGGLGLTRQKRQAWIALAALGVYLASLSGLAALGRIGSLESKIPAIVALGIEIAVLGLLGRIGLAFLRVPVRAFSDRQAPGGPPESAA